MVIHHHQRMAASLVFQGEVTDEIGLPHVVRSFFFETCIRCSCLTGVRCDQAVPMKNIVNGTDTGNVWNTLSFQKGMDN
ncbi:hypothetical protein G153_13668 [Megasphaera sp. BL7]|nr:hypothetical protein G153_13668 [Megasphaera sp. BL7]